MNKLQIKVRELKDLLELTGISDSGREYRVYGFTSAHIGENRLGRLLEELFDELERLEHE